MRREPETNSARLTEQHGHNGTRDHRDVTAGASSVAMQQGTRGARDGVVALDPRPAVPFGAADQLAPDVSERAHSALARGAKRGFDLIGSLLLIVVLAPAWLAFAFLVKLDSPGPILFRQPRVGRDGKVFSMLKYRTMVVGADAHKPALLHLNTAADGLFKINRDPRVTRIGRFLRRTSLDELPQLLHVLTGRMSLVGPRPLIPEEDVLISGAARQRLQMRPGMTGVWQVSGASTVPIGDMVVLDREYIENWSLWLDLKIVLRTAALVLQLRGV